MVNRDRLKRPKDQFSKAFPGLGFRDMYSLDISGEPVLMIDPTLLIDVYNSNDETASIIRDQGVFIMDFGGDVCGSVWWKSPYVFMPISMHLSDSDRNMPEGATLVIEELGTDSGSFMFLPIKEDLPVVLKIGIEQVLKRKLGVALHLPSGNLHVFYEQWDAPESRLMALYRNIVLKWENSNS